MPRHGHEGGDGHANARLRCGICGLAQSAENLHCVFCGRGFVDIRLASRHLEWVAGRAAVRLEVHNQSSQPVGISEIRLGGQTAVSFHPDDPAVLALPGQQRSLDVSFEWPGPAAGLVFECHGRCPSGPWQGVAPVSVDVVPPPIVVIEVDAPTVGPARGYTVQCRCRLVNASAADIERIDAIVGTVVVASAVDPAGASICQLTEAQPVHDVALVLPPVIDSKTPVGPIDVTLRAAIRGADPQYSVQRVTYYGGSELRVSMARATDEGRRYVELTKAHAIEWHLPVGRRIERMLQVTAHAESEFTETEVEVAATSGAVVKVPELDGEIRRFKTRQVPMVAQLERHEDTDDHLVIRQTDRGVGGNAREHRFAFRLTPLAATPYPFFAGLDFGTSNSSIALALPRFKRGQWQLPEHQPPVVLPVESNDPDSGVSDGAAKVMPSVIYFAADGRTRRFGRGWNLRGAATLFKPELQFPAGPIPPHGRTADELAHLLITELLARAEEYLHDAAIAPAELRRVCVSVPVKFSYRSRERIRAACAAAIDTVHGPSPDTTVKCIDEATAALAHYARRHRDDLRPGYYVVYDFGGGTTDVCVVRVGKDGGRVEKRIHAIGGDPALGGRDVDRWLRNALLETSLATEPIRDLYGRHDADVVPIKHALADVDRPLPLLDDSSLDRVALRNVLLGSLEQALRPRVRRVLADVFDQIIPDGSAPEPLTILLAGNSSRLAGFQQWLDVELQAVLGNRYGGDSPFSAVTSTLMPEPKHSVCLGAYLLGNWEREMFDAVSTMNLGLFVPPTMTTDEAEAIAPGRVYTHADADEVTRFVWLVRRGERLPAQGRIEIGAARLFADRGRPSLQIYAQSGVEKPEYVDDHPLVGSRPRAIRYSANAQGELAIEIEGQEAV